MIIESDVYIKQDTIKKMQAACTELDNPGMVAAVTVDESGVVNFPYLYALLLPLIHHQNPQTAEFLLLYSKQQSFIGL